MVLFEISDEPLVKYSDRSRIYNPYFDEKCASPSVLQPPVVEKPEKRSIAEYRMTQLVMDYFREIQKGGNSKKSQRMESELVNRIVENNLLENSQEGAKYYMRDVYLSGQVGTQGPESGTNAIITQQYNDCIDTNALLAELEALKTHLKAANSGDEDMDIILGDVSRASRAIKENNDKTAIQILKSAGNKLYDIAKTIGCNLVATILKNQLGI